MGPEPLAKVSIVDIKIPFLSMVILLVKLSIAAIPAFIIMSIVGSILFAMFGTVIYSGYVVSMR